MAINVSVQHHGGFLPDMIQFTLCYYQRGTHEEVLSLQPMIPPERFDIFSPVWGMLRRLDTSRLFKQVLDLGRSSRMYPVCY